MGTNPTLSANTKLSFDRDLQLKYRCRVPVLFLNVVTCEARTRRDRAIEVLIQSRWCANSAANDVRSGSGGSRCRAPFGTPPVRFLPARFCLVRREIHIILDNLATHKTQKVRTFLATHPQVQLHFTPTYSSWLNQVELWFAKNRTGHSGARHLYIGCRSAPEDPALHSSVQHGCDPRPLVLCRSLTTDRLMLYNCRVRSTRSGKAMCDSVLLG